MFIYHKPTLSLGIYECYLKLEFFRNFRIHELQQIITFEQTKKNILNSFNMEKDAKPAEKCHIKKYVNEKMFNS